MRVLVNRELAKDVPDIIFYKSCEYSDETLGNFQEIINLPFLLRVFHPVTSVLPAPSY